MSRDTNQSEIAGPRLVMLLPVVLVVLAGLLPYLSALPAELVFDDTGAVQSVIDKVQRGEPVPIMGTRPVVKISFYLNAWLVGDDPPGFRAVNVLIHVLAGLVLFAIVREVLERHPRFVDRPLAAPWLAAAVAVLWLVHPLNTQAVTYVVQRSESLMGLFYLLTIYCVLRCAAASRVVSARWVWATLAVLACALGMGTKQVMASAPVVALLFDRAFLGGSFVEALRRRWGLYLGLLATWAVLLRLNLWEVAREGSSAGFGLKLLTWHEYLLSQGEVITHYIRLSFWPWPLVLDYQGHWVPAGLLPWPAWLPGVLFITGLVFVTLAGVIRNRWWGFCGAWFFLILGPTSSFMPIADVVFEHRMYLSLIAVVVLMVFGVDWLLQRIARPRAAAGVGAVWALMAVAVLAYLTVQRNDEYITRISVWDTVVVRAPYNARAWHNLANALYDADRHEEAMACYEQILLILPPGARYYAEAQDGIGNIWMKHHRLDMAIERYETAVELEPDDPDFAYNLGRAYLYAGRLDDAELQLRRAIKQQPDDPKAYNILGLVMVAREEHELAVEQFSLAIKQDPLMLDAHKNVTRALLELRRLPEAADSAELAVEIARQVGADPSLIDEMQRSAEQIRQLMQAAPAPASQ